MAPETAKLVTTEAARALKERNEERQNQNGQEEQHVMTRTLFKILKLSNLEASNARFRSSPFHLLRTLHYLPPSIRDYGGRFC